MPNKNTGNNGACAVNMNPDVGNSLMQSAKSCKVSVTLGASRGALDFQHVSGCLPIFEKRIPQDAELKI